MKRDLLTLLDLTEEEVFHLIEEAVRLKLKHKQGQYEEPLKGKSLAMIFEKSSTRTRTSFEVATFQLGGMALNLSTQDSQLGRGETYADTAKVLSRYVDGIMLRTFSQKNLEALAEHADVPVINGLSDSYHPVQVLSDLLTLHENGLDLKSIKVAYVGDGNNMVHSWVNAARLLGFEFKVACPRIAMPEADCLGDILQLKHVKIGHDPIEAVSGAHVVYTDTWFSMGDEFDHKKKKAFQAFQVNQLLLKHADSKAKVMHCLPAHRGDEITDEVMDGPQSVIFDQAENRLHMQKAILKFLMA